VIVVVTPNPAIDVTYRVADLRPGGSHRVAEPARRAGGKGVNVARVLAQVGVDATIVTSVGGTPGREFEDDLVRSGLRARLVPVAGRTRQSIAVVDERTGEATLLNERGAPMPDAEPLLAAVRGTPTPRACVVGSGSLPPETPASFYARLVEEAGAPAVIDATGPALLHAAEAGAAVVKPNRAELAESTGVSDPLDGAHALLRLGAGLVVVSLGADGLLAVPRDGMPRTARLTRPIVGNATGAGDAAVAAIARWTTEGGVDLDALLVRACAWSAAAVLAPLAGELHPSYRDLESAVELG
jgi:1-phosphofructokinase family hexose kinase